MWWRFTSYLENRVQNSARLDLKSLRFWKTLRKSWYFDSKFLQQIDFLLADFCHCNEILCLPKITLDSPFQVPAFQPPSSAGCEIILSSSWIIIHFADLLFHFLFSFPSFLECAAQRTRAWHLALTNLTAQGVWVIIWGSLKRAKWESIRIESELIRWPTSYARESSIFVLIQYVRNFSCWNISVVTWLVKSQVWLHTHE